MSDVGNRDAVLLSSKVGDKDTVFFLQLHLSTYICMLYICMHTSTASSIASSVASSKVK